MSTSVPEAAREQLHRLIQAHFGQALHLQMVDLPTFMACIEAMADSDESIEPIGGFEAASGVRPNTVKDFSYMEFDDPNNGFTVPGFDARRHIIRNNGWWNNPNATLRDALIPIAA